MLCCVCEILLQELYEIVRVPKSLILTNMWMGSPLMMIWGFETCRKVKFSIIARAFTIRAKKAECNYWHMSDTLAARLVSSLSWAIFSISPGTIDYLAGWGEAEAAATKDRHHMVGTFSWSGKSCKRESPGKAQGSQKSWYPSKYCRGAWGAWGRGRGRNRRGRGRRGRRVIGCVVWWGDREMAQYLDHIRSPHFRNSTRFKFWNLNATVL